MLGCMIRPLHKGGGLCFCRLDAARQVQAVGKTDKEDKLDRMPEVSKELKSRMLAALLYVSSGLGMWCFGIDGLFYYSTCPNEAEFRMLLEVGGVLELLQKRVEGWEKPVLVSDDLGAIWVAENMYRDGKPELLLIMGPVFFSETSVKTIEQSLRDKDISVQLKRQVSRLMTSVPVILHPTFHEYITMLHFTLTGEQLRVGKMYHRGVKELEAESMDKGADEESEDKEDIETAYSPTDPDRVDQGERLLLQAVREGNLNYRQVFAKDLQYGGGYISDSGDDLRDAKNTLLVFNALCCRAAIDGGVPAGTAKEMELANTREIEAGTSIAELTSVNMKLLDDYVKRVHSCREHPLISEEIIQCCDYIRANVHHPLSAELVASHFGYSAYYFTKKFYREMGIRAKDYIKQVRVEYAKVELLASKKSIQEISDSLQFSTRSYFSKVFCEVVGVTPAAYREQNGVKV